MGVIQKETPLFVDGAESFVSMRRPEADKKEGWSVTVRPYRPKPAEDLLKDLTTVNTCFLAGNRVLMADGGHKRIEDVVIGDMVMTMSGPDRVRLLERPTLGMTRHVVEIRGIGDECLMMSDEHPLWVRRQLPDGSAAENWGTYNMNHFMYELRNAVQPTIAQLPYVLNFDLPEQVAHSSGWLHVRPIYHHMDPSTALFNIATQSACTIFVEGFAAYSHGTGLQRPEGLWKGLRVDPHATMFVRQFSAASA